LRLCGRLSFAGTGDANAEALVDQRRDPDAGVAVHRAARQRLELPARMLGGLIAEG